MDSSGTWSRWPLPRGGKLPVFLGYAREDREFYHRLMAHLHGFGIQDRVGAWSQQDVAPGAAWRTSITTAIGGAKAVVLLVSEYLLSSSLLRNGDVLRLLEQRRSSSLMLPVIVRPCAYERVELRFPDPVEGPGVFALHRVKCVNPGGEPLVNLADLKRDEVLEGVARELRATCRPFMKRR